ncbi:transposase [Streptomyces minutiscleroticus]|uniref:transposase n=1 Tax=Streptomyces minutiscleroticus TaxID=68238 RepID=UPI003D9F5054
MTGRNPVDRGKPGSKLHMLSDAQGLPLALGVSGANVHDSQALLPLVLGIPAIRSRRGPRRRRPGRLRADKAYYSAAHLRWLRDRGIVPRIAGAGAGRGPPRRPDHPPQPGPLAGRGGGCRPGMRQAAWTELIRLCAPSRSHRRLLPAPSTCGACTVRRRSPLAPGGALARALVRGGPDDRGRLRHDQCLQHRLQGPADHVGGRGRPGPGPV